jgi:hypothetical protein
MKNGAKMIPKSENACLGWILKYIKFFLMDLVQIKCIDGFYGLENLKANL